MDLLLDFYCGTVVQASIEHGLVARVEDPLAFLNVIHHIADEFNKDGNIANVMTPLPLLYEFVRISLQI